jgi:hypothetical protein
MITIEKTEYSIKSLTIVADPSQHSETDPNAISQQLQNVECNLKLKVDSDGNPIGLLVDLEELTKFVPALIKALGWPE